MTGSTPYTQMMNREPRFSFYQLTRRRRPYKRRRCKKSRRPTPGTASAGRPPPAGRSVRSEEHTSELQSLMRISYAVFCLKKKKQNTTKQPTTPSEQHSTDHIENQH